MTITNGYITLAELRAAMLPTGITSTAADTHYESIIEAASRVIEGYCQRRFYGKAETRYYSPQEAYELATDDFTSLTSIKTDEDGDGTFETTWAATDYNLVPYNAALDSKPYTSIEVSENASHEFPNGIKRSVQLVGVFGYIASTTAANCPSIISEACLLASVRYLVRKDTPLGIAGNPTLGQQQVVIPRITLDPDIRDMLDGYRRLYQ